MATTYFGYCNSDGTIVGAPDGYDSVGNSIEWLADTFLCPGTGNQNIQDLSIYCYQSGAVNIRLGIYSGNTLIAEGTAEIAVTTTPSWQGHMTQASVKAAGGSSPGVLVGGQVYTLAYTADVTSQPVVGYKDPIGNGTNYGGTDYTGGMPTTLPSYENASLRKYVRCGVEPAAGGSAIPDDSRGMRRGMARGMGRGMSRIN